MKLPNGYGSITKLTGNRRKPWMARVTCDETYDETKHDYVRKRIVLGYYPTKKAALEALSIYNESPFKPEDVNITFSQIYEKYKKSAAYAKLKSSALTSRQTAYKYCAPLYNIKIRDLNKDMLQNVIDSIQLGSSSKKNVLTVMRIVIDYAYDHNLINKKYTDGINIEYSDPVIDRIPFTEQEIATLWSMSDDWDVKVLLILLYSGMRVNELLKNYRDNVNLEDHWIYVPAELAKNKESCRYVPIHNKVYDLVKWFVDNSASYGHEKLMLNPNGSVVMYNNFVSRNLPRINKFMNVEHKFHDTRHTFASRGTSAGIPELYMQKIMGHTPRSILYNTYTHITIPELLEWINLIS